MKRIRTWKFRIYPSKEQEKEFNRYLYEGKNLWNHLLEYTKEHYEKTGKRDMYGELVEEQVGWEAGLKEVIGHSVDIIQYFRFVHTPWGQRRAVSFDKNSVVGEIPLNYAFVDMTFQKLQRIYANLRFNGKHPKSLRDLTHGFESTEAFNMDMLEVAERVCLSCGAHLPKDAVYCYYCGKRLVKVEPEKKKGRN